MSWADETYERTMQIYKYVLKDFILEANADFDIKLKEILVRAEMQKRDFTKRQLNIISLILIFSYGYGKETALLKPNDFSITGVDNKKIKEELTKLIKMRVIHWEKDFNEFKLEDIKFWKAPYHSLYDDDRSQELFHLNLKHAGVDIGLLLEKLKNMNK